MRDTYVFHLSQTAVIHARIDPATMAATKRILETMGLTPTEAIRLLYRQIAKCGEFPFELSTEWRDYQRVVI